MPQLGDDVLEEIRVRLGAYLANKQGYGEPEYVDSGGTAALYRVETPSGRRAIKVYAPAFLEGPNAEAERKRLGLQKSLIGHHCPNLVEVFEVVEEHGTAFVEMEFLEWKQLKSVLQDVPDDKISLLIRQLVAAVNYLEKIGVVHRDIKPENIHVSADFSGLKLIDLGVARELEHEQEEALGATDHGAKRPFIATAQYSSPEYLFRLDAPSPLLWKGLNIYQVGAVLHDLINKRPIFQDEVDAGNKWLVARAILTQVPTFPDSDPTRLSALKLLASRCLTKELQDRLELVDWTDFESEAAISALEKLRALTQAASGGNHLELVKRQRLDYDRKMFVLRTCDSVRNELIPVCVPAVSITMVDVDDSIYRFRFGLNEHCTLLADVEFSWQSGLSERSAQILLGAAVSATEEPVTLPRTLIQVGTILQAEDVTAKAIALALAGIVAEALQMAALAGDCKKLHGCVIAAT